MPTRPLRTLLTGAAMLAMAMAMGQQKAELDLRVGFSPALDPAGRKVAFSVLQDLDPTATISFSDLGDVAKFRSQEVLDPGTVRQTLIDAGLPAKVSVNGAAATLGQTRQLPAGYPTYVDTGDPVADQATYRAAKEAWILAHPDLYDSLVLPADATTQPTKQP